jgi:hypothetical protein
MGLFKPLNKYTTFLNELSIKTMTNAKDKVDEEKRDANARGIHCFDTDLKTRSNVFQRGISHHLDNEKRKLNGEKPIPISQRGSRDLRSLCASASLLNLTDEDIKILEEIL